MCIYSVICSSTLSQPSSLQYVVERCSYYVSAAKFIAAVGAATGGVVGILLIIVFVVIVVNLIDLHRKVSCSIYSGTPLNGHP